jgi:uncharacterized protein (DUF58 family)
MRESLVKRAAGLRLSARILAKSMKTGVFRSHYQGKGIDFAGVREYFSGDDVRSIDWNVTARLGRPYVKLFEEERELSLFLLMDCSASMCAPPSRQDTALETAALLALAAEHNNSPSGALFFDAGVRLTVPPEQGKSHTMLLLSRFDALAAEPANERPPGTDLAAALKVAAKLLTKKSLIFVISDFRTTGWAEALSLLTLTHDVAAVIIEDPTDTALPRVGLVPFRDNETGERRYLPTNSGAFRDSWRAEQQRRSAARQEECARRGAASLVLSTTDDPASRLNSYFSR